MKTKGKFCLFSPSSSSPKPTHTSHRSTSQLLPQHLPSENTSHKPGFLVSLEMPGGSGHTAMATGGLADPCPSSVCGLSITASALLPFSEVDNDCAHMSSRGKRLTETRKNMAEPHCGQQPPLSVHGHSSSELRPRSLQTLCS